MDVFVIGQLNSEYQDMQSSIFVSKSQAGSTEYIVHVDVAETAKVELSISKPEQIFNLFPNNWGVGTGEAMKPGLHWKSEADY